MRDSGAKWWIALAKQAVTYTWLKRPARWGHLHGSSFPPRRRRLDKKAILFAAWQRADFYGEVMGSRSSEAGIQENSTLCIELSRQVDTASDYAGKIKSLAMTLLQVATDQADYDESWSGGVKRAV